jgi:hypothetical protein
VSISKRYRTGKGADMDGLSGLLDAYMLVSEDGT